MLSEATPSLRVRTTSRCGSRRLGIVSIYPYRAHTATGPVTGAFPGLSGDIVDPNTLTSITIRVGKGFIAKIRVYTHLKHGPGAAGNERAQAILYGGRYIYLEVFKCGDREPAQ